MYIALVFEGAVSPDASALNRIGTPLVAQDCDRNLLQVCVRENLALEYHQRGFLRFVVKAPKVEVLKQERQETRIRVTYPVVDGIQYRFAGIHWSGNRAFPPEKLSEQIHLKLGGIANALQLEKDLQAVQRLYASRGYARAHVTPQPLFQDATSSVSYDLEVSEGEIYRMGKLSIAGIDPSAGQAMEKLCRLKAGDTYDQTYWNEFLRSALRDLRINSASVTIGLTEAINDAAKSVDVTVRFAPLKGH
jgi:outer membrane protein assembly factor BamA